MAEQFLEYLEKQEREMEEFETLWNEMAEEMGVVFDSRQQGVKYYSPCEIFTPPPSDSSVEVNIGSPINMEELEDDVFYNKDTVAWCGPPSLEDNKLLMELIEKDEGKMKKFEQRMEGKLQVSNQEDLCKVLQTMETLVSETENNLSQMKMILNYLRGITPRRVPFRHL